MTKIMSHTSYQGDGIEHDMIASKEKKGPPYIPFYKHITKLKGLLSINGTANSISETSP